MSWTLLRERVHEAITRELRELMRGQSGLQGPAEQLTAAVMRALDETATEYQEDAAELLAAGGGR